MFGNDGYSVAASVAATSVTAVTGGLLPVTLLVLADDTDGAGAALASRLDCGGSTSLVTG